LALAARHAERPTARRGVTLTLAMVVLFYTHVVPFGLAGLGVTLLLARRGDARTSLARWAPLLPAIVVMAAWLFTSPAGTSLLGAVKSAAAGEGVPALDPLTTRLNAMPDWLTNVLPGPADALLLAATG